METSTEIAQTCLNLSNEEFFTIDAAKLTQIEWKMSSYSFLGLAVNAPSEIQIARKDSMPVLLASQFNALRDWDTPVADNLALIVFDHDTANVSVIKPFEENVENRPDPGSRPQKSPKPTGDAATGVATSVQSIDIRRLFSLEWRPRRLSVTALSFDVISNEAIVSLVGNEDAIRPVSRGIAPRSAADGKGLPSYDPAIVKVKPVRQGVSFTVQASPQSCIIRGALAMIALERHISRKPLSDGPLVVATVVPVSFILTKQNWKVPWVFEWGIPVLGDREIAVGDALSTAFAIPLPDEKLRLMPLGEYAAYVVMEGRVYGPEEFSIRAPVR